MLSIFDSFGPGKADSPGPPIRSGRVQRLAANRPHRKGGSAFDLPVFTDDRFPGATKNMAACVSP